MNIPCTGVITGGMSGLGAATATRLAAAGIRAAGVRCPTGVRIPSGPTAT